jgi:hypothetical protein
MKFMHSFQSSPSKENHFTWVNYFQRRVIYIEETWCQVSFIFPFPFLSPLEQAHFIQPQLHESRISIIWRRSRFNFNRSCVFLTSVRDTSRMQTNLDTERPRSISYCRTFYNSSWGIEWGPKQNNVRTLRTKDDDGFRVNHKIVRPQTPHVWAAYKNMKESTSASHTKPIRALNNGMRGSCTINRLGVDASRMLIRLVQTNRSGLIDRSVVP